MKNVKELYQLLKGKASFSEKYPFFKENDNKVHVLYVAPCINGTGFYRMIVPMLELNKTDTHAAIISTIHKWSFAKQFDDYDNPIDTKLIAWADYVVLPAMFSDVGYIIKSLRKINNELQFVMDLDCNYHAFPKEHPNFKKYTNHRQQVLLQNIVQMNLLIGASQGLLAAYEVLIERHHPQSKVELAYHPNLISNFGFQEVPTIKRNEGDKLRIGIIGNYGNYYDTLSIKETLIKLKEKYKDQIELVFFGWDGKLSSGEQAFKELEFTFEKSVSFLDYYAKLNDLLFDLVLLPSMKTPFNTKGKSFIKYLELSAFAIPVVASASKVYQEVIEDKEDGMLATSTEEWLSKMEQLIEDAPYRRAIGKAAFKNAWRNYSYTSENTQNLSELFL